MGTDVYQKTEITSSRKWFLLIWIKSFFSSTSWRQFTILVWKSWLLQKERKVLTLLLLSLPLIFPLLSVIARGVSKERPAWHNEQRFSEFALPSMVDSIRAAGSSKTLHPTTWSLAYSPNTSHIKDIMTNAAALVNMKLGLNLAFGNEEDLVNALRDSDKNVFAAVVFLFGNNVNQNLMPQDLTYEIRFNEFAGGWHPESMFPPFSEYGPTDHDELSGSPGYSLTGFLTLQHAIDLSIIKQIHSTFNMDQVSIFLKKYPYPEVYKDSFVSSIPFGFFTVLSFMVIVPMICAHTVLEKENKFRETMKLTGMRPFVYLLSWLLKYWLILALSVVIMTIIFHVSFSRNGPVLPQSDATVTLIFLLLYALALLMFSFTIASLFPRAINGAMVGLVIYILTFLPYLVLENYESMKFPTRMCLLLDFNLAMTFGWVTLRQWEETGIGLHWTNLSDPIKKGYDHTMGQILVMLMVDAVIYSILFWYFDAILPGDFGCPQPIYFPFTRKYWFGTSVVLDASSSLKYIDLIHEDKREFFEEVAEGTKVTIKIRGLTKYYDKRKKAAVNDINIDIYEGDITAVLGHNGAGKSTTMFMLTGFLPATKGTAFINDLDIQHDLWSVRQHIGFCSIHNILFGSLTVREHLTLFSVLNGFPKDKVEDKVKEMVTLVDLEDKLDVITKALSYGMKRKLSIAIALMTDSRIVLLDEPTSGIDPEFRREIWDILQRMRNDRTIVFSTNSMDEADILGDRIMIMADGEIQCYGTPGFLKIKFGMGYKLTIAKTTNCNVKDLRNLVKSHVPNVKLDTNIGYEISLILPYEHSNTFEQLFTEIQQNQSSMGVDRFSVSMTTMEDVFLR